MNELFSDRARKILNIINGLVKQKKQKEISVYPQDALLKMTVLRIIPEYVDPTFITILRIILTPAAAYVIVFGESLLTVLVVYVLVSSTDLIDGAMARTRNQITDLGKILDPIADKLLFFITGLLIMPEFGYKNLFIVIVSMELLSVVLGYFFYIRKKDMSANMYGKIKMLLQVSGMIVLIIAHYTGSQLFIQTGALLLNMSIILHIFSIGKFLLRIKVN